MVPSRKRKLAQKGGKRLWARREAASFQGAFLLHATEGFTGKRESSSPRGCSKK